MQLEILKDLINRIAPNDGTPDTKGIKQRLDENESGDKKQETILNKSTA